MDLGIEAAEVLKGVPDIARGRVVAVAETGGENEDFAGGHGISEPPQGLLGAILRTVKGVEVSEDALSFDVIRDVVLGEGHYLGHAQTFSRMKTDFLYPEIADRSSINEWHEAGCPDIREAARDTVRKVLSGHYPTYIPDHIDAQLRNHFNIVLPRARMRPGNGVW